MTSSGARERFVRIIPVERLPVPAAVALLRARGVAGNDDVLGSLVVQHGSHALTVDLLGGYIAHYCRGDPARLPPDTGRRLREDSSDGGEAEDPLIDPAKVELRQQERRLARVASWYREKLEQTDPAALALLEPRVCSAWRYTSDNLTAIFTGPDKVGISGPKLAALEPEGLIRRLRLLSDLRLLEAGDTVTGPRYTSHPAIRDGFLSTLGTQATRLGHAAVRLGLEASLSRRPGSDDAPSDSAVLDLLEEIVHHAAQAGDIQAAWEIYQERLGGFDNLGWALGDYERGERVCRELGGNQAPERIDFDATGMPATILGRLLVDWGAYLLELGRVRDGRHCLERVGPYLRNLPDYMDLEGTRFVNIGMDKFSADEWDDESVYEWIFSWDDDYVECSEYWNDLFKFFRDTEPAGERREVKLWIERGLWLMRAYELEGRIVEGIAIGRNMQTCTAAVLDQYDLDMGIVDGATAHLLALSGQVVSSQALFQKVEWRVLKYGDDLDDTSIMGWNAYGLMLSARQTALEWRLGRVDSAVFGAKLDEELAKSLETPGVAFIRQFLNIARADLLIETGEFDGAADLLGQVHTSWREAERQASIVLDRKGKGAVGACGLLGEYRSTGGSTIGRDG